MSTIILQIRNLTKIYTSSDRTIRALDGISLDLYTQEIFCLLGVNGAGKTTLSAILATLHPPTSGDVVYQGISIYKDLMNYRRNLGFCPQVQNLDQYLTVKENLIFAGRYFLLDRDTINDRVDQLLEHLELQKYANSTINELSGGTKQRILIARALMHNPKIVILDEPTVGLDPDIRRKLWSHIRTLKDLGITVIITTHYLDEAEILADRVCIMHQGSILLIESVAELKEKYQNNKLEDIFVNLVKQQINE